jgi:hypothetical protein
MEVEGRHGGTLYPMQKGEKARSNGRPKGSPNASTILKRILDTKIKKQNPLTGADDMTGMEVINMALFSQAANGNVKAYQEIIDRTEGKVLQKVDVTTNELRKTIDQLFPPDEEITRGVTE